MVNNKKDRKQSKPKNKPKPESNLKVSDKDIIRKLSQSSIILKTKSVKEMANDFELNSDEKPEDNTSNVMDEDQDNTNENPETSEEDENSTEEEEEDVFKNESDKTEKENPELTETQKNETEKNDKKSPEPPESPDLKDILKTMNKKLDKIDNIESKVQSIDSTQTEILKNLLGLSKRMDDLESKTKSNELTQNTRHNQVLDKIDSINTRVSKIESDMNNDVVNMRKEIDNIRKDNDKHKQDTIAENAENLQLITRRIKEIEDAIKNNNENIPISQPLNLGSTQTIDGNQGNIRNNEIPPTQTRTPAINKPRFASSLHEKKVKFEDFRKRLALRVEIEDFQRNSDVDISQHADSIILRGPSFHGLRVKTITNMLSENTGIHRGNFRIVELHVSSKNFNIAWIQFDNEQIVRNIFKQSAIVQSGKLNMFPVVPEKGINRKKSIENKLKSLQKLDTKLRYQIRLGESDFRVFVKIYRDGEYDKFREIPTEFVDPNDETEKIRTFTTNTLPEEESSDDDIPDPNDPNWTKINSKKSRRRLKKLKEKSKKKVSETQVMEFIYAYLRGTKTTPWDHFLGVCPMEAIEQEVANPTPSTSSDGTTLFQPLL